MQLSTIRNPWQARVSLLPLQGAAAVLLAAKLLLLAGAGPFMDEAYYWMWGQHPALSYFDHPPLNAWLQGLAGLVFGWNRFALRIMVALAIAGDIAFLYLLSRRLMPTHWQPHFWLTLVLFLATPMFVAVTAVALPDHLLVLGLLGATYFFTSFLMSWRGDGGSSYRDLYLGAALLGLAALAKYNAVLLGLGLGATLVLMPRYRGLLRQPQLFLAAAIALLLQAPVLLWNLQQDWASFGFILSGRQSGGATVPTGGIGWLAGAVLFLSPVLLAVIVRFLLRPADATGHFARVSFLTSTLTILAVSFFTATLFHWNLVAYVAVLPFLAWVFPWPWLYWLQVGYGGVVIGFMLVNYALAPLTDVQAVRDEATAWVYGWDETAAAVAAARVEHAATFVATPDYTTASLLGFAMRDPSVTSLSPRTDQYDFWFDPAAYAGADAILLGDDWRPLSAEVVARFEEVTLLREVTVERLGRTLDVHRIYLGSGFRP